MPLDSFERRERIALVIRHEYPCASEPSSVKSLPPPSKSRRKGKRPVPGEEEVTTNSMSVNHSRFFGVSSPVPLSSGRAARTSPSVTYNKNVETTSERSNLQLAVGKRRREECPSTGRNAMFGTRFETVTKVDGRMKRGYLPMGSCAFTCRSLPEHIRDKAEKLHAETSGKGLVVSKRTEPVVDLTSPDRKGKTATESVIVCDSSDDEPVMVRSSSKANQCKSFSSLARVQLKSAESECAEDEPGAPSTTPTRPRQRLRPSHSPISQVSTRGVSRATSPSFFGPMDVEERTALRKLVNGLGEDEIFAQVDSVTGSGQIKVLGYHAKRLTNFKWIEDEVVNAVVNLANNRFHGSSGSIYFHTGWFWHTLLGNSKHWEGNEFLYERVKRFAKTYSFRTLRLMLVPINEGDTHWTLGVVDFRNKCFMYIDSLNRAPGKEGSSKFSRTMSRWLKKAAREELGKAGCDKHLNLDAWKSFVVGGDYPQQTDANSCGVFMLVTAISLAFGKVPDYSQRNMVDLRFRLAKNLKENFLSEL